MHIHLMRSLLKCVFVLSCAECYAVVVRELCGFGGRALKRLIELLEVSKGRGSCGVVGGDDG